VAGGYESGGTRDLRKRLALGGKGNFFIRRDLQDRMALAREFRPEQRSPVFRMNGTRQPQGPDYAAHMKDKFVNWQVAVEGLVARPQSFSMAQLMAGPKRTPITRHDCVGGWDAIGKGAGVPLKLILDAAGRKAHARQTADHRDQREQEDRALRPPGRRQSAARLAAHATPTSDGMYFSRIVTSSSAMVGWTAQVESHCGLVTPIFTAMAAIWMISGESGPTT